MTSPADDRLESAFSAALDCSEAERREFLVRLSNDDPTLAREVESLLAAGVAWGDRFEIPANRAYGSLLTTLHDGRGITESDLSTLVAQMKFLGPSDGFGLLRGYVFQECVASGNTGFVFRALDPQLGRPVAIKVLAPSIAEDAPRRREFLNEARMASRIRHPNVVTIFHVSADDATSVVFFVMEWVAGRTLQSWLDQNPRPSREAVLRIVEQTAQGLMTIHAAGIVHRDLKPGNILCEASTGRIVIVDFGLAFEGHTDADLLAGTPMYMSPEQLRGETVTARSDLFSLGAITFQLIYQRHPFDGHTLPEVTAHIMQGATEFPVSNDPHDLAVQAILKKCLHAEPEQRFATADDFLREFRAAWVPEDLTRPTRAAPADLNSISPPPIWRRYAWWFLLIGVVLSAMTLPWIVWPRSTQVTPGFVDRDTYINSLGMRFRRVPAPKPIPKWPPFPEHRELTERLDWRNMDFDLFLGECEVTRREFAAVMGDIPSISPPASTEEEDLPVTGITFDEAEAFCRKLTELDSDGQSYSLPEDTVLTYAAYGFDLLSRGATPETLVESQLPIKDTIVPVRQANHSSLGLVGISGNVWEWTGGTIRKPSQWEGVVSFAATGELPAEENRLAFGGGARDLFVHAYDMNCGINDFLEHAENAYAHTEPDDVTKYLCPQSLDQPMRLIYHYTFASPMRSAKLVTSVGLHVEKSEIEIRVRKADRQDSEPAVEEWRSVFKHRGLLNVPHTELDLTEQLAGATEAWLEFRLQADDQPRHYTQFARTNPFLKLPNVCRFEAELESAPRGLRSQVVIPRSHRSPFVGFRAAMRSAQR